MPASDYLAGLLFFAPTLAGALGGAGLLVSKRFPDLGGSERIVAFGILGVIGVLAIHLLPAALGILTRGTVVVSALAWVAAAAVIPATEAAPSPRSKVNSDGDAVGRVLSSAAIGLAAVLALAIARDQLFLAPTAVDTLNFHLPSVISWIQSGSIWDVGVYLADVAPGHYPNNGDVLLLAAVLPWSNDFLSHLALYPVWLLTGIATYALGRELRASREAAAVAAALLLVVPAVLMPALIWSYTDALALLGFAAGILFLLRHARTGSGSELLLAGLALGVAFGTKWYGVPYVAVILVVWVISRMAAGRPPGTIARQGAVLVAAVAIAGGVWMLRNWIDTGNPVFPVRVAPLGVEIFDAPRDVVRERAGFTLAGYLDDPQVWSDYLLPQFRETLASPALLLLVGAGLAGLLVIGGRGRQVQSRGLVLLGLLAAGAIVLIYVITPYGAGGPEGRPDLAGSDSRYVAPALLLGAALTASAASRFRHGTSILAGLSLIAIVDAAVQVSDSTLSGASIDRRDWGAALALVAAVVIAWLVWRAISRARPGLGARRRPLALGVTGGLALAAVCIGGYEMQKRFNGVRYAGQDPTVDRMLQAGRGLRVGLAGTWTNGIPPVLPAFGPRLDNEVTYVGRDRGFVRQHRDRSDFLSAVRRGGYDYLFVGNGIPPRPDPDAVRWARNVGFEEVAQSERLTLLRAPGGVTGAS
jgi:hypothetical protein